ncbi:hypothetical protein PGT21_001652 [Puccinia graminis f. sp. tritici]|uniref:Uncharacterized protein n=1 Tax=Puccinia graminis f. sp. tritici TaxID=56615 RepID=A0A5B0QSK8_PUCGR|nr:hypothetical protein PGT21_001652 [Puccinia graminis f. sp. tritici]
MFSLDVRNLKTDNHRNNWFAFKNFKPLAQSLNLRLGSSWKNPRHSYNYDIQTTRPSTLGQLKSLLGQSQRVCGTLPTPAWHMPKIVGVGAKPCLANVK